MNATTFFNAMNLAMKPATIGFFTIFGLGITTACATAISTLLALLIPILVTTTKAAIYVYPLFLVGLITLKIKEQYQTKETDTIALLPPCKLRPNCITQEEITNEVLISPPPIETLFKLHIEPNQPTWEQWILNHIQPETLEAQSQPEPEKEISQLIEQPTQLNIKPLNNRLTTQVICWQVFSQVSALLDNIKASEMKEVAVGLEIPKYRKMNKTQLLVEIVAAHESAPAFSQ